MRAYNFQGNYQQGQKEHFLNKKKIKSVHKLNEIKLNNNNTNRLSLT